MIIIIIVYTSRSYRALSWSPDAWALITFIALLSSILVLGLLWMGLCSAFGTLLTLRARGHMQVKIVCFTNVLEHNKICLNDTLNQGLLRFKSLL